MAIKEGFFVADCVELGHLVFYPMCGSGTMGKIALIHRRRFIGVDISEEYIAIATERVKALNALKTINQSIHTQ